MLFFFDIFLFWIKLRTKNFFSLYSILKEAANEVTKIEMTGAGVKIGGAAAGLVGTGLVVTGLLGDLFY